MTRTLNIIAVVIIMIGVIAGVYTRTESGLFGITTTTKPYQDYMIPMVLCGVILIVVGLVTDRKKTD